MSRLSQGYVASPPNLWVTYDSFPADSFEFALKDSKLPDC